MALTEEENMVIKVCPDPHCDTVWHNVKIKQTRCKNCGGWLRAINLNQYKKKFSEYWFQYDYQTEEIFRLNKEVKTIN